jgi:hypothetical protein
VRDDILGGTCARVYGVDAAKGSSA